MRSPPRSSCRSRRWSIQRSFGERLATAMPESRRSWCNVPRASDGEPRMSPGIVTRTTSVISSRLGLVLFVLRLERLRVVLVELEGVDALLFRREGRLLDETPRGALGGLLELFFQLVAHHDPFFHGRLLL